MYTRFDRRHESDRRTDRHRAMVHAKKQRVSATVRVSELRSKFSSHLELTADIA